MWRGLRTQKCGAKFKLTAFSFQMYHVSWFLTERGSKEGSSGRQASTQHFGYQTLRSMESDTTLPDIAKESLLEEGFFDTGDQAVGQHVWRLEQRGFPFNTEDGLDFLLQNIFGNSIMQSIVNWFFGEKHCVLAHCLRYGALPGHIESFLGGRDARRDALMVHFLAKSSKVDYYAKSHLHVFPATKGPRKTRELSRDKLLEAGCEVRDKNFGSGGSVILDARLGCEIREGYAITVILMTEDLVARVGPPPMRLRDLPTLKMRVASMRDKCPKIRLNFLFGDSQEKDIDNVGADVSDR